MASRRLLIDAVVLSNYVGEFNDVAAYQKTVLKRCYCTMNVGASPNTQGKKANDSGRLYIFDANTIAVSPEGDMRRYVPYKQWLELEDKSAYWTLSDAGTDYFQKEGCSQRLKITGFSHKKAGSKRMWHYEVDGK